MKKKIFIAGAFIILIAIGIYSNLKKKPIDANTNGSEPNHQILTNTITCQIKGEVVRPGVYTLDEGSRLIDLVRAAGGFTSKADTASLNFVLVLSDSNCYIVNKSDEQTSDGVENLININKAGISDLTSLPGIGEAKAKAIIAYREEHGNFNSVEELTNVTGISEKLLSSIIDLITAK